MPWQEDRGISGSRRTRSAARDGAGATLASIAGVTITREGRYSLPKDRLGTPRNATEALATPSRQPASLHGLRVSSPLEADSDRLLGPHIHRLESDCIIGGNLIGALAKTFMPDHDVRNCNPMSRYARFSSAHSRSDLDVLIRSLGFHVNTSVGIDTATMSFSVRNRWAW